MTHRPPIYTLGINAYHGDVSAVLLRNGELVIAVEEERFRRIKHWAGFPTMAIQRCLAAAAITGRDVNHVAVSRDPKAYLVRKAAYALTRGQSVASMRGRLRNLKKVHDVRAPLAEALGLAPSAVPRLHFVEHHPAHLASAFFVSPFDDASICALDGFGDYLSSSLAVGSGNRMRMLARVFYPHSLGLMYTAVTQHLGFMGYGDEFKVMGLAPYGEPSYLEEIRKLVRLERGGMFKLALQYFMHWKGGVTMEWESGYPSLGRVYSAELERLLGPARAPDEPVSAHHENIARSLQAVYEECLLHVLNGLWDRTKNPRLCLAGGCAMNSVANGKVRANTQFRELYIQPAAADNGTALGAAYFVWHQILGNDRSFVMEHAYWGTEYPHADLTPRLAAADEAAWRYDTVMFDDEAALCRATAELIAAGNVVGWFQGRMEWGSRALGNRSILADPRRGNIRDIINLKIKFREKFRPFAPSILEERLDDYFVGAAADPFMQQVYPVRPDKRAIVPAITHVDGTGRLQTVSARTNPRYYRLIQEFEAITGVPLVLNTSFNENEPIVDTPDQALDCFLRTRMDAIVVGDTLIKRVPVHQVASVPVG